MVTMREACCAVSPRKGLAYVGYGIPLMGKGTGFVCLRGNFPIRVPIYPGYNFICIPRRLTLKGILTIRHTLRSG